MRLWLLLETRNSCYVSDGWELLQHRVIVIELALQEVDHALYVDVFPLRRFLRLEGKLEERHVRCPDQTDEEFRRLGILVDLLSIYIRDRFVRGPVQHEDRYGFPAEEGAFAEIRFDAVEDHRRVDARILTTGVLRPGEDGHRAEGVADGCDPVRG